METFVEYLKRLPIIPRKTKKGIRVTLANGEILFQAFENIDKKEVAEGIEWLKKNKLHIPFSENGLKELVR